MMSIRALPCLVILAVLHAARALNEPPDITTPKVKDTNYYSDGETVVMECKAEGNPAPKYRWLRDGKEINSEFIKFDKITGTLTIPSFSVNLEGYYMCLAENVFSNGKLAVAMSAVLTLRKGGVNGKFGDPSITFYEADRGAYAGLYCEKAPVSHPPSQITWHTKDEDTNKGQVNPEEDPRLHIDANGTLHFLYAENKDDIRPLAYCCGMYNKYDNAITLSPSLIFQVTKTSGALQNSPPVLRYHTQKATFIVSETARLECVFSGYPVPTVTWSADNAPITAGGDYEIRDNGRTLLINNVDISHEKTYNCKGNNGQDNSGSIWLDVTSGPIWVNGLSSQTVPEGEDAIFTCQARALAGEKELAPPVWYMNGEKIFEGAITSSSINPNKFEFSDQARILTIKNVNKAEDIFCLQCNVSNNVGYEFGRGCLTVVEPIVIITQPDKLDITVEKGQIVNLTVIGKTDPELTLKYRWFFNGEKYETAPPHFTYDEVTKIAYINTSRLTQEEYETINGTYKRELYHDKNDQKFVEMRVYLADVVDAGPIVAAAAADLWWIALVVALVILIVVIVLIVFICNRMRQEGTYPLDKKERANDLDPEKDLKDSGFHDLARADGDDDYPGKKSPGFNPTFDYGDDLDMGDDDESLMEYGGGDFDTTKFNEDGSFIGQYSSKKTPDVKQVPQQNINHQATESQI